MIAARDSGRQTPRTGTTGTRRGRLGVLGCLALSSVFVGCSSQRGSQSSASLQPAQSAQAESPLRRVVDAELAGKSSSELAAYVFEHHGCKSCHTLGNGGKLGFTERGQEAGKNFEGCIALLTTMISISQINENERTQVQKETTARFQEFGCTTCHQMAPGKPTLTEYGSKLASLHMACTDVEKILAGGRRPD